MLSRVGKAVIVCSQVIVFLFADTRACIDVMNVAFETLCYFEPTEIIKWSPFPFRSDEQQQLPRTFFSSLPLYVWTHFFHVRTAEEWLLDTKLLNSTKEGDWNSRSEPLSVPLKAEDGEHTCLAPLSPLKSTLHAPWILRSIGERDFYRKRPLKHPSLLGSISSSVLVRRKRVHWEPEDCWSSVKRVIQQIDAVQSKQWKWWREENQRKQHEETFPLEWHYGEVPRDAVEKAYFHLSTVGSISPSSIECKENGAVGFTGVRNECSLSCDPPLIPSISEMREAMLVAGHLLPYYAVNCENKQDLFAMHGPTRRRNSQSSFSVDRASVDNNPLSIATATLLNSKHMDSHSEKMPQEENSSRALSNSLLGRLTHHTWLIEPCAGSLESLLLYSFRAGLHAPSVKAHNAQKASEVDKSNKLQLQEKHEVQLNITPASDDYDSICECSSSASSSHTYQISSAVVYSAFSLEYPSNCEESVYRWSLQDLVGDVLTALWVLHFRCDVAHGDVSIHNILWRISLTPIAAACSEEYINTVEYSTKTEKSERTCDMRNVHFVLGDLETLYPLPKGFNRKASGFLFQRKNEADISSQKEERKSPLTALSPDCQEMLHREEKSSAPPSGFRGALLYTPLELIEGDERERWSEKSLPLASAAGDVWAFGVVLLQILLTRRYIGNTIRGAHEDLRRSGENEYQSLLKTHPFARHRRRNGDLFSASLFDRVATEQRDKHQRSVCAGETSPEMESTIFEIIFLLEEFKQECAFYDVKENDQRSEGSNKDVYCGVKRVLSNMYGELSHFSGDCVRHSWDERDSSYFTPMDFLSRCLHPNPALRATVEELIELKVNWDL